ncbi:hypothetical protein ABGV38_04385 [Escherichia coli]
MAGIAKLKTRDVSWGVFPGVITPTLRGNDTNANKKKENDKLLKCRHINILAMVYMMVINPEAANFIYRTVISDLFYTEYITAA